MLTKDIRKMKLAKKLQIKTSYMLYLSENLLNMALFHI